ncbi:hypothetical protein J3A64_001776 [Pseudarthrobacter sp. PvP004]|nr:hypothetical protein [Pseudarthrobacter sp. PvP004]
MVKPGIFVFLADSTPKFDEFRKRLLVKSSTDVSALALEGSLFGVPSGIKPKSDANFLHFIGTYWVESLRNLIR